MISCGVTRDFGVIAAESGNYRNEKMSYESPKVFRIKDYLMTYIGHADYFKDLDQNKFSHGIPALSIYLENHLRNQKRSVQDVLNKLNVKDEPRICVFVLGVYGGKPTLCQFNSFSDFKPSFTQASDENQVCFGSIFYGEDGYKKDSFEKSQELMENLSKKWKDIMSPGILGEILTRGIHLKCDLEEEASKIKYAGGAVSVASITKSNEIASLSNVYL